MQWSLEEKCCRLLGEAAGLEGDFVIIEVDLKKIFFR
jgi:hypothetical protein